MKPARTMLGRISSLLALSTFVLACGSPSEEPGEVEESDLSEDAPEREGVSASGALIAASADVLTFKTPLVADATRCRALRRDDCSDVDLDGLTDKWEDAVLARFEPRLELDEKEKGLKDPRFRLGGMAGRVVARDEAPTRIVVFFAFAFSEDYGACGFTEHHGDVERAVIELARVDGTNGDVKLVKAFTAAHEGNVTDASHTYEGDKELTQRLEFLSEDGSPRWLLYTARNKHGTFASKRTCESKKLPCLSDYCGADGMENKSELRRLLPMLNAGEPDHPRDSDWTKLGYPNADAWSSKPFCGAASGGDCDSAPRGSLIRDPFTKKDL